MTSSAELAKALDDFKVPEREKQEVLAAFAAEKGEVTAGSQPGRSTGAAGIELGVTGPRTVSRDSRA